MINRFFPLAIIFSCCFFLCKTQQESNKSYIDFILTHNKLFALTSDHKIDIFSTNTYVIIIEDNHRISIVNNKKPPFKRLYWSKNKVYDIVFNSAGEGYLVTDKGIDDLTTGKLFLPDTTFRLNHQIHGWSTPSAVFMDRNDNIWLGFGFGEWGGELFIFNTAVKKFIKPVLKGFKITLNPIKSIFDAPNGVYISCGMDHMETSGCIMQFKNFKCYPIFDSETHFVNGADISQKPFEGEYIGPATYNKKDSCIYFYSQNGLFKGNADKDLSQINNWTKIASPKLHWTNGQPDAVGSPMNVLKMAFAENGKLFLVAPNDGIGVYDGKTFHLLN